MLSNISQTPRFGAIYPITMVTTQQTKKTIDVPICVETVKAKHPIYDTLIAIKDMFGHPDEINGYTSTASTQYSDRYTRQLHKEQCPPALDNLLDKLAQIDPDYANDPQKRAFVYLNVDRQPMLMTGKDANDGIFLEKDGSIDSNLSRYRKTNKKLDGLPTNQPKLNVTVKPLDAHEAMGLSSVIVSDINLI